MSFLGLLERVYYLFHRRGDLVGRLLASIPRTPETPDILDFGGGTGWLSRALSKAVPGTFTVADIDRTGLSRARKSSDLRAVEVSAQGPLPFLPKSFDCILLVDVVHHLPNTSARLSELVRCLRPGGRMLIVEFDGDHWMARLLRILSEFRPDPCLLWSAGSLSHLCASLGLSTSVEPLDGLRYLLRAVPGSEEAEVSSAPSAEHVAV